MSNGDDENPIHENVEMVDPYYITDPDPNKWHRYTFIFKDSRGGMYAGTGKKIEFAMANAINNMKRMLK